MEQLIEVHNLSNSVVKSIKPPVQTNEIFYGGTASLILSSMTTVTATENHCGGQHPACETCCMEWRLDFGGPDEQTQYVVQSLLYLSSK